MNKRKELTPLEINRLSKSGNYPVGGVSGLYLQVTGSAKSWILRAVIGGKRRKMGLGSYPSIGLAAARELARDARQLITQGIDPIEERKDKVKQLKIEQSKRFTFQDAALAYITLKEPEWKNLKHRNQWVSTLTTYAFPTIGALPVSEIEISHLLQILQPIWLIKTETASRVRGRIEQIIDWSIFCGYREGGNPARWKGNLEFVLQAQKKINKVKHHPAVMWEEMPLFIKELKPRKGVSAKALLFHILTVARAGEVYTATWNEIDLEKKVRFISAEMMKMDREHRIPLSTQAMDLLSSLKRKPDIICLFESPRGGQLSDMAMTKLMRDMDFKDRDGRIAVPHGFRSTFTDWASEKTDYQSEVIKMAKAHAIDDKVEAAYRRGTLFNKRIKLMQDWADYCFSII